MYAWEKDTQWLKIQALACSTLRNIDLKCDQMNEHNE